MTGVGRFSTGDHVHVAALGKGTVREVRNGGRYLVELKGRHVVVDAAQLKPLDEPRRPNAERGEPRESPGDPILSRSHVSDAIDLHGFTAEEAVAALDAFLNEAILAGLAEVRIIHGRSGGRLKSAVHGRLKVVTSVQHYRLDPSNPGVTLVSF